MKKLIIQLGTWLANLGLLGILSFNLSHLREKAISHANQLTSIKQNPGQLLTDNPAALLQKIEANGVPLWVWIVSWGSLVVTVAFIISWLVLKQPRMRLWLLRANLIWIAGWLLYFIIAIILITYALANSI